MRVINEGVKRGLESSKARGRKGGRRKTYSVQQNK